MSVVVAIHYQIYLIIEWNQRRVDEEEENWWMHTHTLSYDDDVLRFWNYVSVCVFWEKFFFSIRRKKKRKSDPSIELNWKKKTSERERAKDFIQFSFRFTFSSYLMMMMIIIKDSNSNVMFYWTFYICTAHRFFFVPQSLMIWIRMFLFLYFCV